MNDQPWDSISHVMVFGYGDILVAHEFDGVYTILDGPQDYTVCGRYGGRFLETRYTDWSMLRPCQTCWKEDTE